MRICIGFDGSDKDDFTCIRAETLDGWQFTPTYGPDKRPTIWDPAEWGGRIPRSEVHAAMDEIFEEHDVERGYFDPPLWKTEIEEWALKYGDERVLMWETYRVAPMHAALERFIVDLGSGAVTHDGCPTTEAHIANARMFARTNQRYILLKPSQTQKIDAAVTSVITHEAAADARADGWTDRYVAGKGVSTAAYGFS
jgi:hypothetical protein